MDKHSKKIGQVIFRVNGSGRYSVERRSNQDRYGTLYCSFNPWLPSSVDYALNYIGSTAHEKRDLIPYIHDYYCGNDGVSEEKRYLGIDDEE